MEGDLLIYMQLWGLISALNLFLRSLFSGNFLPPPPPLGHRPFFLTPSPTRFLFLLCHVAKFIYFSHSLLRHREGINFGVILHSLQSDQYTYMRKGRKLKKIHTQHALSSHVKWCCGVMVRPNNIGEKNISVIERDNCTLQNLHLKK